jgi:hypothetical protein
MGYPSWSERSTARNASGGMGGRAGRDGAGAPGPATPGVTAGAPLNDRLSGLTEDSTTTRYFPNISGMCAHYSRNGCHAVHLAGVDLHYEIRLIETGDVLGNFDHEGTALRTLERMPGLRDLGLVRRDDPDGPPVWVARGPLLEQFVRGRRLLF